MPAPPDLHEPALSPADTTAYLARLNHDGANEPTVETLRTLHLAHLHAVPFENLDISLGRPIRLDEVGLVDKIVRRRRGGFCYELNGLFALLLRALGFEVRLLAAQFPRRAGEGRAPIYDHLTLLVRATDDDRGWLADVGAGRGSFVEPIPANPGLPIAQALAGAEFKITAEGRYRRLLRREPGMTSERQYRFSLEPRALADFNDGCRHHQTSPSSPFTRGRVCSLVTPAGRVTLVDRRLILTDGGERTEQNLPDEAAYRAELRTRFDIDLDQ